MNNKLGAYVKERRLKLNKKQEEMTSTDATSISRIERGLRFPGENLMRFLCEELDLDIKKMRRLKVQDKISNLKDEMVAMKRG